MPELVATKATTVLTETLLLGELSGLKHWLPEANGRKAFASYGRVRSMAGLASELRVPGEFSGTVLLLLQQLGNGIGRARGHREWWR